MNNAEFLEGIKRNRDRIREYALGKDGRDGKCDCIGLIIGAIRLMGGVWNGTHGSNYAARNEMLTFGEIINKDMLWPGDVVYKAKKPGQSGYALPSGYNGHPDRNDYYHVGVVTAVAPLEITHCTSAPTGIKVDKNIGQWKYYGRLKKVQGSDIVGHEKLYKVVGGNLRMRTGPGVNYQTVVTIPDGSLVTASEISGESEWMYCKYGTRSGYCMAQYLEPLEVPEQPGEETVTIPAAQYEELRSLAEKMVALLNGMK